MQAAATAPPAFGAGVLGGLVLATVRVRTDVLEEKFRASAFTSVEQLIRSAGISRKAWEHLSDPNREKIDLRVLGSVMVALDASFDDLLLHLPEEPGR